MWPSTDPAAVAAALALFAGAAAWLLGRLAR